MPAAQALEAPAAGSLVGAVGREAMVAPHPALDIPAELQGVSVKELIQAIGKQLGREGRLFKVKHLLGALYSSVVR